MTNDERFRIRMMDGRQFEGTPHEIVAQMGTGAMRKFKTLNEYLEFAVEGAKNMMGIELTVTGTSDHERCASFIRETLRTKLARKIGSQQQRAPRTRPSKRA